MTPQNDFRNEQNQELEAIRARLRERVLARVEQHNRERQS